MLAVVFVVLHVVVYALLCGVVVLLSVAVAPYLSCGSVTLCCVCKAVSGPTNR